MVAKGVGATIQNDNNTDKVGVRSLDVGQRSLDVSQTSTFDWTVEPRLLSVSRPLLKGLVSDSDWILDQDQSRLATTATTDYI